MDKVKRPRVVDRHDRIGARPFPKHSVAFIRGINSADGIVEDQVEDLSRQIPAMEGGAHI